MGLGRDVRNLIAKRAAKEIKNGMVVNLGIGIPSLVPNHLPEGYHVFFHAENGILGMGSSPKARQEDENLCNAAGYPVTITKGASYFDSAMAFGMIRRGKLDVTILGSLQVSEKGDLANWIVPGKRVPGMGGAMELSQKAKKVIVLMNHCDKYGNSKIVKTCSLPITTPSCVHMIITELGVMEVTEAGITLKELMPEVTLKEIIDKTDANFIQTP
ncbi:putative succinyl-CoA:3-ketoacid coenzyme A transferase subunit B [Bacillus sp. THAF10]|uniref:3-oxoacid CoA-transferase subunit B n=1 Tax=Bacillus sp. THAF10 TaxID=2587848 RepID=UPI00126908EA|nr:3-oxoacid CoA-transferase subunit B [Bacillus sp. THAF10]QFT89261.1 putative succinyl-CoA:3-ketoacid coenzyme A transferase subunit B [Bacillus sp. THAF10]